VTADAPAARGVVGLDVDAVSSWIEELGVGARAPLRFARIGHGQSNLTFLVADRDGRRWVLRRPPLGHLLAWAHDVAREHRILAALHGTSVPAPRMLGLCADPRVSDVPLVLMEHVEGLVVDDMATAEALPPERRRAIGLALPSALASVHAVDLERTGLADLASHKPYATRQLKRWHGQWERSRTRDLPAIDHLAERLRAAAPEQRELTLVHGDFHLLNVVVAPGDGSVRAILDWELCTLGDPLADLGGLLAYWPTPGDPAGAVFPASALDGFPSRAELAAVYADLTGRTLDELGFWHVLGLWKIAIIAEGVLRRARDEPRNVSAGRIARAGVVDDIVARAEAVATEVGV
jgi:aminoglycoside phosphotransferase (APT) family kinase protein